MGHDNARKPSLHPAIKKGINLPANPFHANTKILLNKLTVINYRENPNVLRSFFIILKVDQRDSESGRNSVSFRYPQFFFLPMQSYDKKIN